MLPAFSRMENDDKEMGRSASSGTTSDTGRLTDVFSVMRWVIPGFGCLWCSGLISTYRLAWEAKTDREREDQSYFDALGALAVRTLPRIAPHPRSIPLTEARVYQAYAIPAAERTKHSDLAVVLLSQSAVPLPCHTDRLVTLFLEGALIDVQTCTDLRANPAIGVACHSIHHGAMFPRGVGQKVLQHLIVAIRYRFDHALHVALLRLHQAKQILLCRLRNRMVAGSKVLGKWSRKSLILAAQTFQRFVIANPIFELDFSVICSRSYLSRKAALI